MPATCVRTTRPATADELAVLMARSEQRGAFGCLSALLVPFAVLALVLGLRGGWVIGAGILALGAILVGGLAVAFLRHRTPIRGRARQDHAAGTVEVLAVTGAAPLSITAMHSSVDPAFAFEIDGGRTLVLLGQWLREETTFGGTRDAPADADAGDAYANALPPPNAFPTSAFTVHRFPISGEVLRIQLTGPYVQPPELNVDLRSASDYPSRIYDVVPSRLGEVIPAPR
jgi:hypothetical protein